MRIAFLNPWKNAAENQAARSLGIAARTLGVELAETSSPEEVEAFHPALVLSASSSVPKVVNLPSYLTMHEPSRRFLENPFYLQNFLSYDGYLTISDSLARFVRDVCFGVGRVEEAGFYYNSPQAVGTRTDLEAIVARDDLRVVYIGTNWDRRLPGLLRALDARGYLRIHGPLHSWEPERYEGYEGPLPFDGQTPQRVYAESGLGLVLLSKDHLHEDIISNRIFEISSVGAVALCPDIPWIRQWFADSVLYLPRDGTVGEWAGAVDRHYAWCRQEPGAAQDMASQARNVFEEHFSAERMLANLLDYHDRKQRGRRRVGKARPHPDISVIVRCGGRPREMVEAAIRSVAQQTFGRFTVILSKYDEIDVRQEVVIDRSGAIVCWKELTTLGGSRVQTLFAGLRHVTTEYFAILDDDDFWLDDHVESLFDAARRVDQSFDVAFSGSVCISAAPIEIETNVFWDRNVYTFGFRSEPLCMADVTREFASNCFVARTDLIEGLPEDLPDVRSAEDSFVVALVCRRKRPVFSYRPTAFFRRGWEGESMYDTDEARRADLTSVLLRCGFLLGPQWLGTGSLPASLPGSVRIGFTPLEDGSPRHGIGDDELRAQMQAILASRWWRAGRPIRHLRRVQLRSVGAPHGTTQLSSIDAGRPIYAHDPNAELRASLDAILDSRWWRLGRPYRYVKTLLVRWSRKLRSAFVSRR